MIMFAVSGREQKSLIPEAESAVHRSAWYARAMEQLVGVVQALSQARTVDAVTAIVRDAARSLTGADGATFVLRDGDQCHYVDENSISPLWKGRRFPMSACISGWAMLNARSAVIEDIYSDSRIPADAYRPTFVKSLAMVPIRRAAPIGAIGNYWATRRLPTVEEVTVLQALADTTSVALENAHLYEDLRSKIETLEEQRMRIDGQRDALEVFTRALAHDLKEPVRSIRAFSELMGQTDISGDQSNQYLKYIQRAADRMGMLVETVFHYTQLDDPEGVPKGACSMTAVVDMVKEDLAKLISERRAVVTSDPLPDVHANPAQMAQVLQNLVSNAIRHGNRPVAVHIRSEERADHWLFSVVDNGLGIAPEDAEKIFIPFKRLKRNEDGAGLGLAICRKIIVAHGGSIRCEPSPGTGATFCFALPKAVMPPSADDQPSTRSVSDSAAQTALRPLATVLLVDDREDDIDLTRYFLFESAKVDCNVQVALDGEQALMILREPTGQGRGVNLMLLDINMPGMSGFELLERMGQDQELQRIPVVMCTGSAYEKDKQRAEALGAVGYLVKPPSFEALNAILKGVATLQLNHHDGRSSLHALQQAAS